MRTLSIHILAIAFLLLTSSQTLVAQTEPVDPDEWACIPFGEVGVRGENMQVRLGEVPEEDQAQTDGVAYYGVGIGLHFPDGLFWDLLGDTKLGFTIEFAGPTKDVDLESQDQAFSATRLNLIAEGDGGIGLGGLFSWTSVLQVTSRDLEFQGQAVPAGTPLLQTLFMVGGSYQFGLHTDLDWGLEPGGPRSIWGIQVQFLLISKTFETPDFEESVGSLMPMSGVFVLWRPVADVRIFSALTVGPAFGGGETNVGTSFELSAEYVHPERAWDIVEFGLRGDLMVLSLKLGERYLVDPNTTEEELRDRADWVQFGAYLFARIWLG